MRNLMFVAVLATCSVSLFAQGAPRFELFGGVSFADYQFDSATVSCCTANSEAFDVRMNPLGVHLAATLNVKPWLGLTSDFSAYSNNARRAKSITYPVSSDCGPGCVETETDQTTIASPSVRNFLFGPQFSRRVGKVRLYGHVLLGSRREKTTETDVTTLNWTGGSSPVSNSYSVEDTQFAAGFGGSADYQISKNLNWRIGADYLTNQGTGQNNARISAGLLWKVGTWKPMKHRSHVRP